ncbi:hypothetical protein BGZ75_008890 [Mortierella antarctica]|nr:hypothetical protein BGZ67_006473 [Mortierella alpina]KAF9990886.1 hypothetical protein BGZ75_008890 [Mortierella antarctica]
MRSNLKVVLAAMLMALIATAAMAAPKKEKGMATNRRAVAIRNQSEFCMFLPPPGQKVSAAEDRGIAFCTKAKIPGASDQVLPRGFIQSAHFITNKAKGYVQVTGRMDSRKYKFRKNDDGGQYDLKAPRGSMCVGYSSFVQLIEPDANIYCIRCCKNKADCPVNKSTYGCKKVLPGSYA